MTLKHIRVILDSESGFVHSIPGEEEFVVAWRGRLPTNPHVPENNEAFTQALRERPLTKTPADKNNESVTEAQLREVFNKPTNPKIVEPTAAEESQGTANYGKPKASLKTGFTNFMSKHAKKLLGLGATALVVAAGIFSTQTRQNVPSNSLPAANPAITAAAPARQSIIQTPIANPTPALNDDTAASTANKIVETFIAPSKTGTERIKLFEALKGFPKLAKKLGANANTPEEFTKRYELIKSARENSPKGLTAQITLARGLQEEIQKLPSSDRKAIEIKFVGEANSTFVSIPQPTKSGASGQSPTKAQIPPAQPASSSFNPIEFFTQPMRGFDQAVFGRAAPAAPMNISNYAGAHEMVRRTAAQAQQAGQQLSGTKPNLGWKLGQRKRSYNRFRFVA